MSLLFLRNSLLTPTIDARSLQYLLVTVVALIGDAGLLGFCCRGLLLTTTLGTTLRVLPLEGLFFVMVFLCFGDGDDLVALNLLRVLFLSLSITIFVFILLFLVCCLFLT